MFQTFSAKQCKTNENSVELLGESIWCTENSGKEVNTYRISWSSQFVEWTTLQTTINSVHHTTAYVCMYINLSKLYFIVSIYSFYKSRPQQPYTAEEIYTQLKI